MSPYIVISGDSTKCCDWQLNMPMEPEDLRVATIEISDLY
jgi:hypothetical protein